MPPLESLADAMVTQLNASGLTPTFTARWDYDTDFDTARKLPTDPIDVLLLVKAEETSVLNRIQLGTQMEIEIAIRAKLANRTKATVLAIRELCEAISYYWAPPRERRIAAVNKVWLKTRIDQVYDPAALKQNLYQSVATLTFGITR